MLNQSSSNGRQVLTPRQLVDVYSQFHHVMPNGTRPAFHVAVMCRKPVEEVLECARQLGFDVDNEETRFSGQQAAAIVRKLYNLDEPSSPKEQEASDQEAGH